jgi:hypothetical protein
MVKVHVQAEQIIYYDQVVEMKEKDYEKFLQSFEDHDNYVHDIVGEYLDLRDISDWEPIEIVEFELEEE